MINVRTILILVLMMLATTALAQSNNRGRRFNTDSAPACCEPAPTNIPNIGFLQDCNCRRGNFNFQSSQGDIVSALKPVCECYKTQNDTIPGNTFRREIQNSLPELIAAEGQRIQKSYNGILSQVINGPNMQSQFLGGRQIDLRRGYYGGSQFTVDDVSAARVLTQQITRAADLTTASIAPTVHSSGITQSMRDNLQINVYPINTSNNRAPPSILELDPTKFVRDLNQTNVDPQHLETTCASMKDYLKTQQIPFGQEFYQDLTLHQEYKPNDWNTSALRTELRTLFRSGKTVQDPEVKQLSARIKFLFANPLFISIFNNPGNANLAQDLHKLIKDNYLTPGCADLSLCANNNRSTIGNAIDAFYNRPDVLSKRDELKGSMQDEALSYLPDMQRMSSQIELRVLRHGSQFEALSKPLSAWNGDISPAARECARIEIFERSTNELSSNQPALAEALGDANYENEIARISDSFNPDKEENNQFGLFVQRTCATPHCPESSKIMSGEVISCAPGTAKTFKEFMTGRTCAKNDPSCWQLALGEYLSTNRTVDFRAFRAGRNKFNNLFRGVHKNDHPVVDETTASTSDATAGTYFNAAATENMTVRRSSGVYDDVKYTVRRNIGGVNSETPVFIDRNGKFVPRSVVERYSATPQSRTEADSDATRLSPIRNNLASTAALSPSLIPTSFSQVNTVQIPSPIAPAIIPAENASLRAQVQTNESETNALVSQLSQARENLEKTRLESQIDRLTREKLNLENQLRPQDTSARSRMPASDLRRESDRAKTGSVQSNAPVPQVLQPQIQAQSQFQNFGSGPSSVNVPVSLSAPAGSVSAQRSSRASNFSFKYDSDAKSARAGTAALIVAGDKSAFEANSEFADAVNQSAQVDIGSVTTVESSLLAQRDVTALSRYADVMRAQPGSILRLVYQTQGGVLQEVVVGKNAEGILFFPQVRNLAVRRLEQMRAVLNITQ